jgi:hypothetical protein
MRPSPWRRESHVRWLLRYARNRGMELDHSLGPEHALRAQFSVPGWRLMCRSGRDPFLPVIANRKFDFGDLQAYVAKLIDMGWQVAPAAHLIQHVVDQSYLYVDEPPDAPIDKRDLTLVRIAEHAGIVSRHQFAQVREWVTREKPPIDVRRSWDRMVNDARAWRLNTSVRLRAESCVPWEFAVETHYIGDVSFTALKTPFELWEEGVAMSNCLYAIRRFCVGLRPSRFFSTVELQLCAGGAGWFVRDARLSFNRLPGPELAAIAGSIARAYTEAAAWCETTAWIASSGQVHLGV